MKLSSSDKTSRVVRLIAARTQLAEITRLAALGAQATPRCSREQLRNMRRLARRVRVVCQRRSATALRRQRGLRRSQWARCGTPAGA